MNNSNLRPDQVRIIWAVDAFNAGQYRSVQDAKAAYDAAARRGRPVCSTNGEW